MATVSTTTVALARVPAGRPNATTAKPRGPLFAGLTDFFTCQGRLNSRAGRHLVEQSSLTPLVSFPFGGVALQTDATHYLKATPPPHLTGTNSASQATIAAWSYRSGSGANNGVGVWTTGDAAHRFGFNHFTDNNVYYIACNGNTGSYFNHINLTTLTGWHHYVVVFDGSQSSDAGRLKLYVDGVERAGILNNTIPTSLGSTQYFGVGVTDAAGDVLVPGIYADAGIWNRALSPSEVFALYAAPTRWSAYLSGLELSSYYDVSVRYRMPLTQLRRERMVT